MSIQNFDNTSVDVKTLTPFKRFIMTIGELPTNYIDSLSYAELVTWFCDYLQNKVIPTVDNNAEAIVEIQNFINTLDLQDEVNNKLDEMAESGQLQELLDLQYTELKREVNQSINAFKDETNTEITRFETTTDNEINNFRSTINNTIAGQNNKINSLQNFSPIVVTNTSEMTDQTKVYLLTTDDKWYYYNGTTWTPGGDYNTQAIADGSIDILKFDDNLKNSYDMIYDEPFELEDGFAGYVNVVNGQIDIVSTTSYKYYVIDLTLGSIYNYVGMSRYSARGLVVADTNGNVILNTTGNEINNLTFKVNQSGLKAYVGEQIFANDNTSTNYDFTQYTASNLLRELKSINSKVIISDDVEFVEELNSKAIFKGTTDEQLTMRNNQSATYNVVVYAIKKGETYSITYTDRYLVKGCVITDDKYLVLYSATESQYPTSATITYTATSDGFVFLNKLTSESSTFTPTIKKVISSIDVDTTGLYSIISDKTIAYDGDSITQSRINQGNQSNGGAFPKLIADLTSSFYVNNATGGATLSYKSGASGRCISRSLTNLPSNADMYIFSGGINDYWDSRPFGTLSSSYADAVDDTTIIGALEQIFRYALSNFVGKPILFVITHKVSNPYNLINGKTQFDLHDALVSVCKHYSIPYYDAFDESGLNGWNTEQKNAYLDSNASGTPDGTHPNETGYMKYYVPQLLEVINKNILK